MSSLLVEKIKYYKNMLLIFYFINMVSVTLGIVLSIGILKRTGILETELLLTAIISLLFGAILPFYFIYRIKRKILLLQKEVEKQIQTWVRGWMTTYQQYGEKSFQNSEFWLKIVLLSVEQIAQYNAHPAVFIGAQISSIIRQELDKKSSEATA